MKAIVMTALMTLGLTGGVAAADGYRGEVRRDEVRDHRAGQGRNEAGIAVYRDYHHRPAIRFERHEDRRGFRWIGGEWRWSGAEWSWAPGHYVRAARW